MGAGCFHILMDTWHAICDTDAAIPSLRHRATFVTHTLDEPRQVCRPYMGRIRFGDTEYRHLC